VDGWHRSRTLSTHVGELAKALHTEEITGSIPVSPTNPKTRRDLDFYGSCCCSGLGFVLKVARESASPAPR
jgi:hypothetical protein